MPPVRFKTCLQFALILTISNLQAQTTTYWYNKSNQPFWFDTTNVDKPARNFFKALELGLVNQFAQSATLLYPIATDTINPLAKPAQSQLALLYFFQNQFQNLLDLSQKTNSKINFYGDALFFNSLPSPLLTIKAASFTIPFTIRRKSLIVVDVLIQGRHKNFVLDTGFSRTAISRQLAAELGLVIHESNSPVSTATGSTQLAISSIKHLELGNILLENWPVYCYSSFPFRHIDGAIGLDVLRQISYTVNFPQTQLTIDQSVIDSSLTKNLFGLCMPMMAIQVANDQRLDVFYDSGSDGFELNKNAITKLKPLPIGKKLIVIRGINKGISIRLGNRVKHLNLTQNGYLLPCKNLPITNREDDVFLIPTTGIMGNRPFIKGLLRIDFPNNHYSYSSKTSL
ncbi:retropepsin-like aspartic protease family protein [Larkinella punicea]|nr:retropepsin-like aspartic protease [Larkinella punicea]